MSIMKKEGKKYMNKNEIMEYIERIMCGLGSDEEVGEWIIKIATSVPTTTAQVLIALSEGNTAEEVFKKLYEANIIYL